MKVNVLCGFQSANGFTSLQHIVTTHRTFLWRCLCCNLALLTFLLV